MAGARFGQSGNERLQNTVFKREITIDGKVYTMDYKDPTDRELLRNEKISREDFAMAV
ncbi:hypothetical protein KA037_01470 [Patescibacteria group bacterium]|nr:hypothetical protein [Patescibacteria group bacterium]MBP7841332.1 hypothetical protein [Patescibacteria group bacterium]